MKKTPEEIKDILQNMNQGYLSAFNESLDSSFVLKLVDEYLDDIKKKYILNRIFGLGPAETLELKKLIVTPAALPTPQPTIVSKESGRKSKASKA